MKSEKISMRFRWVDENGFWGVENELRTSFEGELRIIMLEFLQEGSNHR